MSVPTVVLQDSSGRMMGKTVKLGRIRPKLIQRVGNLMIRTGQDGQKVTTVDIGKFFDAAKMATPPPAKVDYSAKAMDAIKHMYGNDQWGDCVWASLMHRLGIWSANDTTQGAQPPIIATDQETVDQYHQVCGAGDNGCDIVQVLNWHKNNGAVAGGKTYKIDDWASFDWTNKLLTMVLIDIFGGGNIGINLPGDWTCTNCTWDITNSRIVGGHDVCICGYDDKGVQICTWADIVTITWAAWTSRNWLEEAYVSLSPNWYGSDKLAPNGFDVTKLQAALATVKSGGIPDPGPGPSTPPVITSLTPNSGPVGTSVTMAGTGLTGATVEFGSTAASQVTNQSDTLLTVVVPNGVAQGSVTVYVNTPSGQAAFPGGFTVTGGPQPPTCPPGQHWDPVANQCVPDAPPQHQVVVIPDQAMGVNMGNFNIPGLSVVYKGGTYPIVQASAMAHLDAIVIPPWLVPLLKILCNAAPLIPPPWGTFVGILCGFLPTNHPNDQSLIVGKDAFEAKFKAIAVPCGGCK